MTLTFKEMNDHISNSLNLEVDEKLFLLEDIKTAKKYFSPATEWFYEATIQGQLIAFITEFINKHKASSEWLVLQEQPYKGVPDNRADICVVNESDESIVIEIKADFILDNARNDYLKLLIANPRFFDTGYVFFCAKSEQVEDWQNKIQSNPDNKIYARGIGKH